jgi:hypothetical protein
MTTTANTLSAVADLYEKYAARIAATVDLDAADYDNTAAGLAGLLTDVVDRLGHDQVVDWLEEAADNLNAVARLGGDNEETRGLLREVDAALYEATGDLELCG